MNLLSVFLGFALLIFLIPTVLFASSQHEFQYQKTQNGVILNLKSGKLKLQIYTDQIIRVTFAPSEDLLSRESLVVIENPQDVKWKLTENKQTISIVTNKLIVEINRKTGAIQFYNQNRKILLQEHPANPHTMTSAKVMG